MEREQKRLEQFRRWRKEIRGSQDYLVVGIDISKDTHNALMRTTTGNTLYRRLIFNNTREGFETLLLQVEAVRVQHGLKEVVFGMEPTANYHKPLGEFLITQDQQVVLVSPEAVKQNRPLLDGRWNKYDGKDCANIADLMCQGKCLFTKHFRSPFFQRHDEPPNKPKRSPPRAERLRGSSPAPERLNGVRSAFGSLSICRALLADRYVFILYPPPRICYSKVA